MFKRYSLHFIIGAFLGLPLCLYSQIRVAAQSDAGPISDTTAPIALGSLGIECKADFQMRVRAEKGKQQPRPVIVLTLANIDNYMTVNPKVRFYVESPGGFERPYLQYTWLKRIAPEETLTHVWELNEAMDWKPGIYKCIITTTGRMGESLHDPVYVRFELMPAEG